MSQIPSFAWIGTGGFVGLVSLYLGFLRPVESNSFFKLMSLVGIIMFAYGFIKMKLSMKSPEQLMQERRMQHPQRNISEVDIDIDDYRNNPHLRKQAIQQGSFSQATSDNQARNYNYYAKQPSSGQSKNISPQHQNNPDHTAGSHAAQHSASHSQEKASQNNIQHKGKFCSQCGTPLLKHHKFCPICGARV